MRHFLLIRFRVCPRKQICSILCSDRTHPPPLIAQTSHFRILHFPICFRHLKANLIASSLPFQSTVIKLIMMEKADPAQKLYNRMRLWEFPDQYMVEPSDGSSAPFLAISRLNGSMHLAGRFIFQFYSHVLVVELCVRADFLFFSHRVVQMTYRSSLLFVLQQFGRSLAWLGLSSCSQACL